MGDLKRGMKSLDTTKNIRKYLPSFYAKEEAADFDKKGLAWCMQGVPPELLTAFDLPWEWPENFGTVCAARGVATKFIEIAEADGFDNDLCSYLLNSMGYCRRSKEVGNVPPESPVPRGLGNPTMLLGSGMACEPRYKWFQAIATRFLDIPIFNSDPVCPPFDVDVHDPQIAEHYLEIHRRDLAAQVEFLEKNLGKKLDKDKLKEIVKNALTAESYAYKTLELCKASPCPMSAVDYFSAIVPQLYMLGTKEAADFYQAMYKEVQERVDKKVGVVTNENHRFIWMGIPPWFNLGFFNYLESLGVVFPLIVMYHIGKPHEIVVDDPLEALVQRTWQKAVWIHDSGSEMLPESCNPAISSLNIGSKLIRQWIKDYNIDGAILHRTRSCRAVAVGQVFYRNVLEEEGIKSMIFESDMADPRQWSDAKIKGMVEAYLETLK